MTRRIIRLLAVAALLGLVAGARVSAGVRAANRTFAVSYTGTDYYFPSDYFTGCGNWTWLTSCYSSSSAGTTAQQLLASDASWIAKNHMGAFQRVWVCLDELMYWNATTGYRGFNPRYLANLDDALATFHANGIKVDLVLYEASKGTSDQYQFHTEALDGHHSTMRASYLQALRDFVNHLAANPTDTATVAVMDLFNEAYYQLEQFGYSDAVIHQWLVDGYNAAHGAQPGFNYTVSDTMLLLKDYRHWRGMYPVDVYDIHVYDDAPWKHAALYARGRALRKPWFAGEAGCAPGHISCTYNGAIRCTRPSTCALSVDTWWLRNLKADGAQAVLVEERNTAWAYPHGPHSQVLNLVGHEIQRTTRTKRWTPPATCPRPRRIVVCRQTRKKAIRRATLTGRATPQTIFHTSFDRQMRGPLALGAGPSRFSGTQGGRRLAVNKTLATSAPHALAVTITGGGRSYAFKQYSRAYSTHDLSFRLRLSRDFALGHSSDYLILAQTVPSPSSNVGKVNVILTPSRTLRLDYFDHAGTQHYLWGQGRALPRGSWHTVELHETVGGGSGSLALRVDGRAVVRGRHLDLGTQGLTRFAVGNRYTPSDRGTVGHLYIDDLTTTP